MATTLVGRKYQTDITETFEAAAGFTSYAYSVVYIVKVDDDCNDEASVMSTAGLPKMGDLSTIVPYAYVTSRSASESQEGKFWEVTINYSTPSGGGSGPSSGSRGGGSGKPGCDPYGEPKTDKVEDGETPPWEKGGQYSLGTSSMPVYADMLYYCGVNEGEDPQEPSWGGKGITEDGLTRYRVTNSAGERLHIDTEVKYVTMTYRTALLEFDFEAAFEFANACNIDDVKICGINFKPYQLKVDDISASARYFQDESYWEASFTLSGIHRVQGWKTELADVGTVYIEAGVNEQVDWTTSEPYKNSANEHMTGPLDGLGRALTAGSAPVFLYWLELTPKDLRAFLDTFSA